MSKDCRRIRELLSAHLDGELAAAEESRVAEHLHDCAECRAILAAYRDADAAFAAGEVGLSEADWEQLAARVDDAIAREQTAAESRRAPHRQADRRGAGAGAGWRSLFGGISLRRLSLGALGSLAVAALVILLFPWREEVRLPESSDDTKPIREIARGDAKKGKERGAVQLAEPTPAGVPREAREIGPEETRFAELRLAAEEAIREGGVAEALAAAQALDGFLTDSPASDHRLEALALAARVWVRLSEIDPARHCSEARVRVQAWEAAAGDSASPQMRELLRGFRHGPCAP
jgi:hypothetical protein